MNEIIEIKDDAGNLVRRRVVTVCHTPSMTKQSMKAECDINGIMKRFEKTGLISHAATREAYFADVSAVPDFASAVDIVRKAEDMFMTLPAKLRAEFDNDAARYVAFCADPANHDRMVELGLIVKPAEPVVQKVEVVNNPPPAG